MTNLITAVSPIGIARIYCVRKLLGVQVFHNLLSSTVEQGTQNPRLPQCSQWRNARQPSSCTATKQTEEHRFCLVINRMRKRHRLQREVLTNRLKEPIPFRPCPGFDTRALFWGRQGLNRTGKLPTSTQRFDQTLLVVRFRAKAVINVEHRQRKAILIRK